MPTPSPMGSLRERLAAGEVLKRARSILLVASIAAMVASAIALAWTSGGRAAAALLFLVPIVLWLGTRFAGRVPGADVASFVAIAAAGVLGQADVVLVPAVAACVVMGSLWVSRIRDAVLVGLLGMFALLVPLLFDGLYVGLVGVGLDAARVPSTATVLGAALLMPGLAAGVHGVVKLMGGTARYAGLERELSEVGAKLVDVTSACEVQEITLDGALEMLPDEQRRVAALLSPDGDALADARGDGVEASEERRWDEPPAAVRKVVDDKETVLVDGGEAEALGRQFGLGDGLQAILVTPARKEDDIHGVLVAGTDGPLPQESVYALEALGEMAGIAIAETNCGADLDLSKARFEAMVRDSADVVVIASERGHIRFASAAAHEVLGTDPEDLLNTSLLERVHVEDAEAVEHFLSSAAGRTDRRESLEARVAFDGEELRHVELRGRLLQHECSSNCLVHGGDTPDLREVVLNMRDITERVVLEEQLAWRALHDELTALPNRALFMDRIAHALAVTQRTGERVGVVFLDLDDFKAVNDSLGHSAGDELLVEFSSRIAGCTRPGDTAARLGGDEFGILLEALDAHDAEAEAVEGVQRILDAFEAPFVIDGRTLPMRASAGLVVGGPGENAQDLLRKSDIAMYVAKSLGGASHVVYRPEEHEANLRRLQRVSELQNAIESGQLIAHYQPCIDLSTGTILGVEALVRWQHPDGTLRAPDDFLSLAEESGLVVSLGTRMLHSACTQAQAWRTEFELPDFTVAVNLSATQIARPDLRQEVVKALEASGLPPRCLTLEITEDVLMHDLDLATERLKDLKGLGVRLAVDDFGTGYSSLAYLQRFPVDTLKIDRTFVSRMDGTDGPSTLVRAIVQLGRALSLRTIAEGVESLEQVALLRDLECDEAQGFHFARALPPEQIVDLLTPPERLRDDGSPEIVLSGRETDGAAERVSSPLAAQN